MHDLINRRCMVHWQPTIESHLHDMPMHDRLIHNCNRISIDMHMSCDQHALVILVCTFAAFCACKQHAMHQSDARCIAQQTEMRGGVPLDPSCTPQGNVWWCGWHGGCHNLLGSDGVLLRPFLGCACCAHPTQVLLYPLVQPFQTLQHVKLKK